MEAVKKRVAIRLIAIRAGAVLALAILLLAAGFFWLLGRLREGVRLYEEGDYQGSVRALGPVIATVDDDYAHYVAGNAYGYSGQFELAERHLRRAVVLQPLNAEYLGGLGGLYLYLGRMGEAAQVLSRAVELDPTHPGQQYNLGVALHQTGQKRAAVRCLRELARRHPGYLSADAMADAIEQEESTLPDPPVRRPTPTLPGTASTSSP